MARRFIVAGFMACTALVGPPAASAQQRAADGVTINDDGQPQYSTFSLCAIDPATGQSGAAVTTRVPFVGRAVPWVAPALARCARRRRRWSSTERADSICWRRAWSRRRC